MTTELQNKAWSVLPKEFKEEVKYKYNKTKTKKIKKECDLGFLNAHEGMFGAHNLTSDTEDEEMLCVKASKVREMYALNEKILYSDPTHKGAILLKKKLTDLFGSKCLHDELNEDNFATKKPQPAEPTVNYVRVDYHGADTAASTIANNCQSQPVTDYFDRIVKDGFRGHNRLHIAAQIVASMIGSDDWTTWRGGSNKEIWHNMAKSSLEIADALIAEAEKGGEK